MAKRILVVEDDPVAMRLATYALQKAGYEVLTAANGVEGLRKAREEAPDLLVLDVMLPGIDGFEVCHRLRSDPDARRSSLPILLLSAKSQEADRDVGDAVGADAYLVKPATPEQLRSAVQGLVAGRERRRD